MNRSSRIGGPAAARQLLWVATLGLTATGAGQAAAYRASEGTATFSYRVTVVTVNGNMNGVTASVTLDPQDLAATTGTVTVPVSTLKTGITLRDTHAKGAEALGTAKFPNATFELTALTGGKLVEGQTVATTATGRLTVKGATKTVTAPIKATLRDGKVNVSTQFKFNPYDFNVRYPGGATSVTVDVAFVLTGS
ncbi:YceI family protein [Deinococcus depolymerans]|uniref:Lipid/polyisoprenoid-binding YceI-like domain-containing protein n=1 Tax=Deinococcus depolymerans TaxID=392408 RepID=A0ABP3MJ32_9DEIO